MKLVVLIPCLNEEKTVGSVIDAVPRNLPGIDRVEVIVIDDGSTDATARIAEERGAVVRGHPNNMGLGVAFHTGLEAALERGADVIVNLDGDGQFNPDDIRQLIAPVVEGRADFVTASRFKDKALTPVMPALKLWGNRRIAQLVSLLVRNRYYDVACGFRTYTREAALNLNLMGKFTYTQETFLEMAFKGFRILEVPVPVRGEREFGSSRVASSIWRYAKNTSKIILRSYRDYRPFWFFGIPSGVCFGVAALLLLIFFGHYFATGQFTGQLWAGFMGGGFALAGLIFLLIAVVTDMLVRLRANQEKLLYYERRRKLEKTRSADENP